MSIKLNWIPFVALFIAGATVVTPITAATVVEVGSTTTLPIINGLATESCDIDAVEKICEPGFLGSPTISCGLCAVNASTNKLKNFTIVASQSTHPRRRSTGNAIQTHTFTVPAASNPTSNNVVLDASIGISYEIRGVMAAIAEASSKVAIRFTLMDTDGDTLVASETLYANEVSGGVDPQATIGAGALLPIPDGQVNIDLGLQIGTGKKVVDTSGSAVLNFLVQRGHTYRLDITLVSTTEVSVLGGLAVASFTDPQDVFKNLSDLLTPDLWLKGIADNLFDFPTLPGSNAIFSSQLEIPEVISFPGHGPVQIYGGLDIPGTKKDVPAINSPVIPSYTIPKQEISFDRFSSSILDMSAVFTAAGIPDLSDGPLRFSKLTDNAFIGFTPLIPDDKAFTDGGAKITEIVITVENDELTVITNKIDISTNTIVNKIDVSTNTITNKIDISTNTINTNIDSSTNTINTNINTSTNTINTNIDTSTTTITNKIDKSTNSIVTNINNNSEEINTNINNALTEIIETNVKNNVEIKTLIKQLANESVRRDIQTNLGNRQCEAWMYTPQYTGEDENRDAKLEIMIDVLQTVIDNARRIGSIRVRKLNEAQAELETLKNYDPETCEEICILALNIYDFATPHRLWWHF